MSESVSEPNIRTVEGFVPSTTCAIWEKSKIQQQVNDTIQLLDADSSLEFDKGEVSDGDYTFNELYSKIKEIERELDIMSYTQDG